MAGRELENVGICADLILNLIGEKQRKSPEGKPEEILYSARR